MSGGLWAQLWINKVLTGSNPEAIVDRLTMRDGGVGKSRTARRDLVDWEETGVTACPGDRTVAPGRGDTATIQGRGTEGVEA